MRCLFLFFLVSICIFNRPAFALDTLHLKNGDKLTGSITLYTANQVNIRTKYGIFDIPVNDLGGVETRNQDAKNFIDHVLIQPAVPMQTTTLVPPVAPPIQEERAEITKELEASKFWGAKWLGDANIGAGLRTGNSETSNVNADLNLSAKWEMHRASLKLDFNREEDDGDLTVNDKSLELTHDYFFASKWFLETSVRFEQDEIDLLDLRTLGSLGLGHQPYDGDLSLKYVFSPGFLNENFDDGSSDNSLTAQWSLDYSQKFYDDLFRLFHEHDITSPTDDFNAFLFQSESGIRVPILRGIVASGQIDFDWDNDPIKGVTEDDTIYSFRLGYEWGK